jgi:membrane-associated phospholipid phosphatase
MRLPLLKLLLSWFLIQATLLTGNPVTGQSAGSAANPAISQSLAELPGYRTGRITGLSAGREFTLSRLASGRHFSFADSLPEYSPYRLSYRRDIPIAGAGLALTGMSAILQANVGGLTPAQVAELNTADINGFDRGATGRFSVTAGQASDWLLFAAGGAPFLYLLDQRTRRDYLTIFVMQTETVLISAGITALVKPLVRRPRPFTYNPGVPLADKLEPYARESFFSRHTSVAAAMTFFTASTFAQYYPDSRLKPLVWAYAATLPAVIGYLRYTSGNHFPTDILTGYVVGAATGILIPEIHRKIRNGKRRRQAGAGP